MFKLTNVVKKQQNNIFISTKNNTIKHLQFFNVKINQEVNIMPKNNIEKLRKQRRLTQEQLADIIGIGRDTLGRYEAEVTDMKVSVLIALADYFNVTTDYILGRSTKQYIDRKKVFDAISDNHLKLISELCMNEE